MTIELNSALGTFLFFFIASIAGAVLARVLIAISDRFPPC